MTTLDVIDVFQDTYLRLGTDRFLDFFHDREERKGRRFVEGTVPLIYPLFTPFYTIRACRFAHAQNRRPGVRKSTYNQVNQYNPCSM